VAQHRQISTADLTRRHPGFNCSATGQLDLKIAVGGKIAIQGKLCFFGGISEAGDHGSVKGYQIAAGEQNGQKDGDITKSDKNFWIVFNSVKIQQGQNSH